MTIRNVSEKFRSTSSLLDAEANVIENTHCWLKRFLNKQNCRIWSDEQPREILEVHWIQKNWITLRQSVQKYYWSPRYEE